MNEIKFYGRGGQGIVMASQMLGLGYFKAGMYPQCYSLFGGERRGAPVVSFLRVDREKILLKCDIKQPDELLYFDPTLVNVEEIRGLMRPGGRILLSTNEPISSFEGLSGYTLGLVDAPVIAQKLGLGHVINTTILGAYCRFSNLLSMDHLISAIEEMAPAKKEANVEAARQGYGELIIT
jgi:2-oxoacid:acceptor oxidoreductase gamma subunit (pyruvate/2-ketoisovalerate family)